MNCARSESVVLLARMEEHGWTVATVLRRSGKILDLISAVALQATRTCSIDSFVAGHKLQAESRFGLFKASLSAVT